MNRNDHHIPLRFTAGVLILLLTSCTTSVFDDQVVEPPLHQVTISLTSFDITTAPMTRAGESTIPENLNRLALKVFDADGGEAATIAQKGTDSDFCSIQLTLAPGTYTFVCILNEAKAATDDALAAIAPATITSATEATIPGYVARDTYTCTQQVTITQSTESVTLNMGSRINARFQLTITDAAPSDVKKLYITINPDAPQPTDGCLSINPTTGRATSATRYSGNKSVSGSITDTTIDLYLPATEPDAPFTTSVKLEGRNSGGTALYTRTLTDVQFTPNNITHATGHLFDPTTAPTAFTFTPTDWTTTTIDF